MRIIILSTLLFLPISGQDHWPSFRGAESRGVSENPDLPDKWSATKNVSWKTDIPGRGWSSPIVWGKKVFLTTVVNQGESESPKKGLYFGGNRLKIPESTHLWKVICLDLKSGEILWNKNVQRKAQILYSPQKLLRLRDPGHGRRTHLLLFWKFRTLCNGL